MLRYFQSNIIGVKCLIFFPNLDVDHQNLLVRKGICPLRFTGDKTGGNTVTDEDTPSPIIIWTLAGKSFAVPVLYSSLIYRLSERYVHCTFYFFWT